MSVHAEDDSLILREHEMCTRDHLRNRPAEAEHNAIRRLAKNFSGQKINICHITTPEGLDIAKNAGFTTEVTMHHMMFEVDRNNDQYYKVNPPIRDIATRDALFKRFLADEITMIGTDHAPHTVSEKSQEFDSAPGGMPGVETTMPIIMNMVRKDIIPISQAVRMGAINPGEAFSLPKGDIKVGNDADLLIFDMRKVSEINVKRLHSKCGHTQYAGWEAVFPDTVIIRGEVQVEGAEFCGERRGADVCE